MQAEAEKLFHRIADGQPGPWWLSLLRAGARGASWAYGLGVRLDQGQYDLGLKKSRHLPVPVIGVGNLSVGGTGKTPLVMAVVESLTRLGLPCGVISRGFGRASTEPVTWVSRGAGPLTGAPEAGDEPVMMASRLRVPIAVGPDRHAVGRAMLAACGPMVLVGDDLFQHRRLHRDLNIVALDAANPLEGGNLLPRGRLRESPAALKRAQIVVLTRAESHERVRAAQNMLRSQWGNGPILACSHRVSGLKLAHGPGLEPDAYRGSSVLAFCGLARPRAFVNSLSDLGLKVADAVSFSDHYQFRARDLSRLWSRARELGATALVCSEKDAARLPSDLDLPVWVTHLELKFLPDDNALDPVLAWGLSSWKKSVTR